MEVFFLADDQLNKETEAQIEAKEERAKSYDAAKFKS